MADPSVDRRQAVEAARQALETATMQRFFLRVIGRSNDDPQVLDAEAELRQARAVYDDLWHRPLREFFAKLVKEKGAHREDHR